ncbi:MAG TPA: gliding motility-associated C-terminal domain-containing protein, partial [Saprospiraceae bacterium]|nr:gliding motility-associated C-terminal domain-containing protein [Saprospiraceae bacterium]
FYLNNEWQDSVFNLTDAGIYTISVEVESCLFSKQFTLEIEDCNIPIYFGNSFSPNDDGINDLFFPQGQDFEGRTLQIFDRWGGLLYQPKEAPFAWDGTFNGQPLNTGVYIMTFTYFNRLNWEEEVVSGEVLLLR